jgi:hypothetical protein
LLERAEIRDRDLTRFPFCGTLPSLEHRNVRC